MKYMKSILMALVCVLALASCNKWLDVNTDPENPSSESALFQNRLAQFRGALGLLIGLYQQREPVRCLAYQHVNG